MQNVAPFIPELLGALISGPQTVKGTEQATFPKGVFLWTVPNIPCALGQ
jgi:hypothetical protein